MRFIEIKSIGFVFSTDLLTVIFNACFGVLSNLAEYWFNFNTVLWIYMLFHIIYILLLFLLLPICILIEYSYLNNIQPVVFWIFITYRYINLDFTTCASLYESQIPCFYAFWGRLNYIKRYQSRKCEIINDK